MSCPAEAPPRPPDPGRWVCRNHCPSPRSPTHLLCTPRPAQGLSPSLPPHPPPRQDSLNANPSVSDPHTFPGEGNSAGFQPVLGRVSPNLTRVQPRSSSLHIPVITQSGESQRCLPWGLAGGRLPARGSCGKGPGETRVSREKWSLWDRPAGEGGAPRRVYMECCFCLKGGRKYAFSYIFKVHVY